LGLDGELASSGDISLEENSSMTKKTIYLIPLILLSFWMIPEESIANTIVQQLISTDDGDASSYAPMQSLGVIGTSTISTLKFYANGTYSSIIRIVSCDESNFDGSGTCTNQVTTNNENLSFSYGSTKTLITVNFEDTITPELGQYVYIEFGSQINGDIYGSSSSVYANGLCFKWNTATQCTDIADMYFEILDNEETNTNTRIIQKINPTDNDTETTSDINFNFTYYYNSSIGGYATSGAKIIDIINNFTFTPVEEAIIASGQSTFSQTKTLNNNGCYSWQPYLKGASTTIYGTTSLFETGTGCTGFQSTVGDTSTTSFFAFLNITQQLRNKSPVGYIYIMADILNNLDNISASSSVDLSMNLASTSAGYFTGTVDFFSADTIGEYLDDDMTNLLRDFMVVITYITTGMTLFALGRKTFI